MFSTRSYVIAVALFWIISIIVTGLHNAHSYPHNLMKSINIRQLKISPIAPKAFLSAEIGSISSVHLEMCEGHRHCIHYHS
jgi:hypothetical protein